MRLRTWRPFWLFLGIAGLVLIQLSWWIWNFLKLVNEQAAVKPEKEIQRLHTMFISESLFFGAMTLLALYLLYRSLRREQQSRLWQKNFIETVSHESKTPLTALKLRLEDIEETPGLPNPVQIEIQGAKNEVNRLIGLVEKMLRLNQAEQGLEASPKREPVCLAETVRAVIMRLTPFLRAQNVQISFPFEAAARVLADADSLSTSIQCLVENAVLHNPRSEKRIEISFERQGAFWGLKIRDNGPGIPSEKESLVFEKFQQASARASEGGLGLYIAKKIIEANEGTLKLVENTAKGVVFQVMLPAESR